MPTPREDEPKKPSAPRGPKGKPGAGSRKPHSTKPPHRAIPQKEPAKSDDPFGIEAAKATSAVSRDQGAGSSRVIVALGSVIAALALGAVGYFYWTRSKGEREKSAVAATDAYQNPSRNYGFTPPSSDWRIDKAKANAERAELAFRHTGTNAWLIIKTSAATTQDAKTPDQEAEETVWNDWRKASANLAEEQPVPARLGDRPARLLVARDLVAGIARRAYVCADQGTLYRLEMTAADEADKRMEGDLAVAARQFHFLAERVENQAPPPLSSGGRDFRGKRLDYSIQAPPGGWQEDPQLTAAGPYADLKLVGPDRVTTLVVAPRETTDLEGVEKAFLRRIEKWSDSLEVRPMRKELTIGGRPAVRIEVVTRNTEGESVSFVTFVKGERHIFRIEGRAPARSVSAVGPVLAQIADTFRILNEEPKPLATQVPKTAAVGETEVSNDPLAAPVGKMSPNNAPTTAPPGSLPPPERVIRATDKRDPRRSLDDLD